MHFLNQRAGDLPRHAVTLSRSHWGAADKPVGTVCFAVCGPGTTRASTKLFAGGRERVRVAAAYYALDLARRYFDTRKR